MEKQVIEYPCQWSFRIIGKNGNLMRSAVKKCLIKTEYQLTTSNTSRSGKYVSLNLEIVVLNEDVRNKIHGTLKNISCVKMVL